MGLQYDEPDLPPTTLAGMSMYKGFVSGPNWAGYDGSMLLANPKTPPPPGAVITVVDVNCFDKPWYPYISQAGLAAIANSVDINQYCPAILINATQGGPATSIAGGDIYAQYEVKLIEPIVVADNV